MASLSSNVTSLEEESTSLQSNNGAISCVDDIQTPKTINNINESPRFSTNNLESTKLNNKFSIFGIFEENLRKKSLIERSDSTADPNPTIIVNSNEIDVGLTCNSCSFPDPIDYRINHWRENVSNNLQAMDAKPGGFSYDELHSPISPRLVTPNPCCHTPNISFYFGSNNKPLVLEGNDSRIRISLSEHFEDELDNTKRKVSSGENNSLSSPKIVCSSPNLLPVASPFVINKKIQERSTSFDQRSEYSPVDMGSFMSYGPICRICHDGDDKEVLLSPCRCSGSVAKVHKSCLERWLSTTSGEGKCELCGYPFTLIRKPKSFFKYLTQREDTEVRRVLISDLICFSILTPLILGVSYLCILGALRINESMETSWADTNLYDIDRRGTNSVGFYFERNPYDRIYTKASLEKILRKKPRAIGNEASGLICLATILMVIYLTWVIIALKFQLKAWRKWRSSNQEISLAITDRREIY